MFRFEPTCRPHQQVLWDRQYTVYVVSAEVMGNSLEHSPPTKALNDDSILYSKIQDWFAGGNPDAFDRESQSGWLGSLYPWQKRGRVLVRPTVLVDSDLLPDMRVIRPRRLKSCPSLHARLAG
jgi:hypothetical protein